VERPDLAPTLPTDQPDPVPGGAGGPVMDGNQIRVPPYLDADARPVHRGAIRPLAAPTPGPAIVLVWPDAPDRSAVDRVARAVERALRAAWPPVATDSADPP
jgi:hypothetical protein